VRRGFMSKDSLREKSFRRQQCRNKKVMPNFLAAIITANRLLREGTHLNPVTVYQCDLCGGIHVGHLARGESILMYGPFAEDVRKLQGL
jgi:hypothetical protein